MLEVSGNLCEPKIVRFKTRYSGISPQEVPCLGLAADFALPAGAQNVLAVFLCLFVC